ncbi:MAG: anthranilate synthase component [Pseudomonadota bacterium]
MLVIFRFYLTAKKKFQGFFFNFSNFKISGSSPEILVRVRNNKITIRPIAGTRPRGKNLKEDNKFKKELLNDKKEISEHLMLLDLGRNDVGKVSLTKNLKLKNIHMLCI